MPNEIETRTEADFADIAAEIAREIPTCAQEAELARVASKFAYTATLLSALAAHLLSEGDAEGSLLLLATAEQMAAHEARII